MTLISYPFFGHLFLSKHIVEAKSQTINHLDKMNNNALLKLALSSIYSFENADKLLLNNDPEILLDEKSEKMRPILVFLHLVFENLIPELKSLTLEQKKIALPSNVLFEEEVDINIGISIGLKSLWQYVLEHFKVRQSDSSIFTECFYTKIFHKFELSNDYKKLFFSIAGLPEDESLFQFEYDKESPWLCTILYKFNYCTLEITTEHDLIDITEVGQLIHWGKSHIENMAKEYFAKYCPDIEIFEGHSPNRLLCRMSEIYTIRNFFRQLPIRNPTSKRKRDHFIKSIALRNAIGFEIEI